MKIDSTYNPATAQITSRSAARPSQEPSAAASVSLSQLASTMQGTEKPPVNAARIQEIKEAIAQGRFKVNPEAIADGLIQSARDLLDSQRKA
ncbi:MAG: flagellar biosynthesis anti-sigma factor FlgM [Betaproteobacteria bacterium]|jgi:negative regulator of flagellin synthesis FlgM|nr:flagellar biosynthesis anti-sigma factor FlgM [Betaproteobacteria bacterium]MBP6188271.1 flagellar biosynthesis anti-sigma factor FlgM [Azonexus sp.]MBP6202560.1 flagellar biosynthesis anti-sigma factor FlgM [Azonexus sp.]